MSSTIIKQITLCGESFEFEIKNKRNKHTYFYFRDGRVVVHKAKHMTRAQLTKYIYQHEDTFYKRLKQMSRYESNADVYYLFGEPYHIVNSNLPNVVVDSNARTIDIPNETALINYEKHVLLDALESLKKAYLNNPYVDINHITFKVSRMKSRYGSCQPSTGKIHINLKLIHMPKHYLDYVFCHEITHLKVHNHSNDFYALLKKICPDYQSIRQALKQG